VKGKGNAGGRHAMTVGGEASAKPVMDISALRCARTTINSGTT